jgi:hypothetical protein
MPLKNIENFTFLQEFSVKRTTISHTIDIYKKDQKNDRWYVKSLESRLQRSVSREEQIQRGFIETIAGEIARLILGNSQPKTRLMEENVEDNISYFVLSKEIPKFNAFYFSQNEKYYDAIQSGKIRGLGGVLVLSLWLDDIDVKQRGNIGVNDSGQVVKIDWDRSLNDMQNTEPDPWATITANDIQLLPNIADFHAYQWLSFVNEGCNEAILKIIIESAPKIGYQYPHVSKNQFDQFVISNPRNPEVFDPEVRKKINIIGDNCSGKIRVSSYNLLRFFLVEQTTENLQQKLDLMQKNASEIAKLDSFRQEVNQTILRIILLPEILIDKFSQCYILDKQYGESSQLAKKITQILIERQQQLIQAAKEAESFKLYMESEQAEHDIRDYYIPYLKSFMTMGKSLLVEEMEANEVKEKIRIRFKKFKKDFVASTNQIDNPSNSSQTFFATASSLQQASYASSTHARRFGL